jgi:hypothetical protein
MNTSKIYHLREILLLSPSPKIKIWLYLGNGELGLQGKLLN